MSVYGMARIAAQRKTRTITATGYRAGAEVAALASATDPTEPQPSEAAAAASKADSALSLIAAYIPSEILTLYIALLAIIGNDTPQGGVEPTAVHSGVFWGFLIATPVLLWVVYAGKVRAKRGEMPWKVTQWPSWEMAASTIAFAAWAAALPQSPVANTWYAGELAGFGVLVTTVVLGLLTPLFVPKE